MATITEIRPGVWAVYARIGGKRHRLQFSKHNCGPDGDPRAAAQQTFERLREMSDLYAGRRRRVALGPVINEYIRFCEIENAPATVKADRGRLRIFEAWCRREGIRFIDEITPGLFDRFKLYYHEERGGSNCNNYVSAVQGLLSFAVRHDLLKSSPMAGYPKKSPRIDPTAFFDLDEINRLLAAAEGSYLKPFLIFLLHLGLRLNELMHLQWCDISIPESPQGGNHGQVRIVSRERHPTKSGKTRVLPVTPILYNAVMALSKRPRLTYVFDNGQNEPLYRSKQWHLTNFKRLAERAGVDLVRPGSTRARTLKTLRDSFATYLIERGVSMFVVSQLLGHSSVRVTERHYVHVVPGSLDAIKKLPFGKS
jgi:integrase